MGRQRVVRTVVAACLLVVVSVVGFAAKIGRDTSQYLQSVSTQRDWQAPGLDPVEARVVGGSESEGPPSAHGAVGDPVRVAASP
jgi:hypothetical protein